MKMKKYIKSIIMVMIVLMWGLHIQADDKELFMGLNVDQSLVKPNVVILMDSSISMNYVLFYPRKGLDGIVGTEDDGYDPNSKYTGTVYSPVGSLSAPKLMARWRTPEGNATLFRNTEVGTNWTGCYGSDGTGSYFQVGTNSQYFNVGERIMYIDWKPELDRWGNPTGNYIPERIAVATIERIDMGVDGNTWFKLKDIQGDAIVANSVSGVIEGHFQRTMGSGYLLVDLVLYGYRDVWGSEAQGQFQDALYLPQYLSWVYCHATVKQLDAIRNFFKYGVFCYTENLTAEIINTPNSWSICDKENYQRPKRLWTRIQVAREVMCWLAREHSKTVMLSLFRFQPPSTTTIFDPAGGDLVEGLGDMSDLNSLVDFLGKIWALKANSWTPLAEALVDVWYYYKPGPDSKTYWPVDIELMDPAGKTSTTNATSDIEWWCQNNYVVIMTDGESTKDDFTNAKFKGSMFTDSKYPVQRQDGWENWTHGWGDPDNNDPIPDNYNPDTATYCPNDTCWNRNQLGTDYLDDVAYFLRHQDLFPDDDDNDDFFRTTYDPKNPGKIWPGDQKIFTYTIGFNVNNHLLQQTAINGDGGYYTADSFEELKQAFQDVITSINLRNFAFSSITAPKKTATASNDNLTVSYVGYFMPSQAAPIWDGHLLAFELEDRWGFDTDDPPDQVDPEEYIYNTQEECLNASGGKECYRWLALSIGQEWDSADKIPMDRSLYTHDYSSANPTALIEFSLTNENTLKPLFGTGVSAVDTQQIINKIRLPQLADIFHSDVGFVGAPPYGKQFITNLNPTGPGDQTFAEFYSSHVCRERVLFAGTNDGIMHMFYADAPPPEDKDNDGQPDCPNPRSETTAGQEVWGFIPDEVLPSLTKIVLDGQHTYTVDGRLTANDIYFVKSDDSTNTWSSILVFGLRRGGRSFYCLDITTVGSQPTLLWKFNDPVHSGQSWGKATIGRIRIQDPDDTNQIVDKWVAVLPGGFEFNTRNPYDTRGKSLFVVDASNGELIWKIAYTTPTGLPDQPDISGFLTDNSTDRDKFLTTANVFNYPVPTAMLAVDKDNNGYLDTIYFGNLGGHLFKAIITDTNPENWTTQLIFEDKYIRRKGPLTITGITDNNLTLGVKPPFKVGDGIMGLTSYATGYVTVVNLKGITVITTSGTFKVNEYIVSYDYDPIYLAPTAAYDTCYQLWVVFGTGDRDRPRSNFDSSVTYDYSGRFIAFRDNGALNFIENSAGGTTSSTLAKFTWSGTNYETLTPPATIPTDVNGLYFNFPNTGERLFDPEPIIIPDENVIPHIYFNTYQPPVAVDVNKADPCDMPAEGTMKLYDIALKNCGALESIEGARETGRIAGGGIYAGKEYVMYTSKSGDVADVPGGEGGQFAADPKRLPYPGGLVFWKEKKR